MLTAGLTEFSGLYAQPDALTVGSDGNLWVLNATATGLSTLSVVAPEGHPGAVYTIPTLNADATALTLGPDGNIWFVESGSDKIGMVTPLGAITEYPISNATGTDAPVDLNSPGAPAGVVATPTSITVGADGSLWFTENSADAIGRLDPTTGAITQYPTPGLSPNSIALGPDGAIWFTDNSYYSTVDRLNADGTVAKYPLPEDFADPTGLIAGPDGALWFAESGNNAIGEITTGGQVTEIPIQGNFSSPQALAFDSAGNIWVTGYGGGLARITPQGLTTIVSLHPPSDISTTGIIKGPDGAIWFTDDTNNTLGRIDPTTVTTIPTDNPLSIDPSQVGQIVEESTLNVSDTLANFYDGNLTAQASDFTAQIQWGDGSTSAGTVVPDSNGGGQFDVTGAHAYAQFGTYAITITVTDVNAATTPQPNTLTISASLDLSNQPIPILDPGPVVVGGGVGPVDFAGTGSGSVSTSQTKAAGAPGATSTGSTKPASVVIKKASTPTPPKVTTGPTAADLFRAGLIRAWSLMVRNHPTAQVSHPLNVTRPLKKVVATITKPAPRPIKPARTLHKGR